MTASRSHLNRVLDGMAECWNDSGKDEPCGKVSVAIAIDPTLPKEHNLFPICLHCAITHHNHTEFLPLADFVKMLAASEASA